MPRYTQPRKTWQYSNEFKVKAVALSHLEDVKVKDVAAALDIHPFMLSRWRKEFREGTIVSKKGKKLTDLAKEKKELDRLRKLENENARLKKENDLLKSGNGIWRNNIRTIWIHPKVRIRTRCQIPLQLAPGIPKRLLRLAEAQTEPAGAKRYCPA